MPKAWIGAGHVSRHLSPHQGELEYGAARSATPEKARAALEKVLAPFDEYAFDADQCARFYAATRRSLEQQGQVIGAMDLLIAAHALALLATLVRATISGTSDGYESWQ